MSARAVVSYRPPPGPATRSGRNASRPLPRAFSRRRAQSVEESALSSKVRESKNKDADIRVHRLVQAGTYRGIIDDVVTNCRADFDEVGIEQAVLDALQAVRPVWLAIHVGLAMLT